jgi:hypothetical protein
LLHRNAPCTVLGGEEDVSDLSLSFGRRIAQQDLGTAVPADDSPLQISEHDRVLGDVFERGFQGSALGHASGVRAVGPLLVCHTRTCRRLNLLRRDVRQRRLGGTGEHLAVRGEP